jgi:hypothetical protein
MYKGIHLVLAVWSIIIGGYIIFINGDRWCIACGSSIMTGLGVVSVVLGLVGLATGLKGSAAGATHQ